jgi:predicted  nucleic acid-binding Zn-ribbon protein
MEQERVTGLPLADRVALASQDEAKEHQRQKLEHDFETASQRLADAQAEIASLKTEFQQLPEKILLAGGRFNRALRDLNAAKKAKASADGE